MQCLDSGKCLLNATQDNPHFLYSLHSGRKSCFTQADVPLHETALLHGAPRVIRTILKKSIKLIVRTPTPIFKNNKIFFGIIKCNENPNKQMESAWRIAHMHLKDGNEWSSVLIHVCWSEGILGGSFLVSSRILPSTS